MRNLTKSQQELIRGRMENGIECCTVKGNNLFNIVFFRDEISCFVVGVDELPDNKWGEIDLILTLQEDEMNYLIEQYMSNLSSAEQLTESLYYKFYKRYELNMKNGFINLEDELKLLEEIYAKADALHWIIKKEIELRTPMKTDVGELLPLLDKLCCKIDSAIYDTRDQKHKFSEWDKLMRYVSHSSTTIYTNEVEYYYDLDAWICKHNEVEKYFGFVGFLGMDGYGHLTLYINLNKEEVCGLLDNNPHPKDSPLHTKYIMDEMDRILDEREAANSLIQELAK
jgi:hypothetical protein